MKISSVSILLAATQAYCIVGGIVGGAGQGVGGLGEVVGGLGEVVSGLGVVVGGLGEVVGEVGGVVEGKQTLQFLPRSLGH